MARLPGFMRAALGIDRPTPPENANGILEIGGEAFRRACAVSSDGTVYLVREYNRAELWEEFEDLRRQWALPEQRDLRPATLADIDRWYGRGSADRASVERGLTAGARRMLRTIDEAAALRASDIKLYVRATHGDLRMKLGQGERSHGAQWQVREAVEAIAWLFDRRDFGDGASSQQVGRHQGFSIGAGGSVPLPPGVAALRGQRGFHGDGRDFVVLRLIYTAGDGAAGRLEDLGFDEDVLGQLEIERMSENGLVIIGGSTGDGKSTTLVRQLERLYSDRGGQVSIVTVEDPVEYPIRGEGVLQIPVPASASADDRRAAFGSTLRCFVRIAPDIGMVSEIRSADDAREILQFVVSGHKIFTTVHSFSANAVLFRLVSLGVSPKELAEPGVVNLVMRQRLVPALCPGCARPAEGAALVRIRQWCAADTARPMLRNREGCPTCLAARPGETAHAAWGGLARRKAVAEWIRVDDTYRARVEARDPRGARAHWLAPRSEGGLGGRTVTDRIREMVARGEVDYRDVTHDSLDGAAEGSGTVVSLPARGRARKGGAA